LKKVDFQKIGTKKITYSAKIKMGVDAPQVAQVEL
jgi:hypothetical protein